MTKGRFISLMTKRGYSVEDLGKMVICSANNYRSYWFFNADGTQDTTNKPYWTISK